MKKQETYTLNYIGKVRDSLGVNQTDLGTHLGLKTRGGMSNKENMKSPVSLDELYSIADFLKVSVYELLPPNNGTAPKVHHHIEGAGSLISIIETHYPKLDPAQQKAAKAAITALLNMEPQKKMARTQKSA